MTSFLLVAMGGMLKMEDAIEVDVVVVDESVVVEVEILEVERLAGIIEQVPEF